MLKNRIVYGFMILVTIGINYYYNSFILDALLYALLSLIPLSILSIIITLLSIRVQTVLAKTDYKKTEEGFITIQLCNKGPFLISHVEFLPFHDFGIYMKAGKVRVPIINGNETYDYKLEFRSDFRGLYQIGIKNIYISDYFNLIKVKLKKETAVQVLYYPDLVTGHYRGSYSAISDDENINGVDFIEQDVLVDIRDYEYGDPLKKIHWNLSAKHNAFLVKKYSSNKEKKATLVVDTMLLASLKNTDRIQVEDQIMQYAVAIVYACIHKNTDIRVVTSIEETRDLSRLDEFQSLYKYLASYVFEHHQRIEDLVFSYFNENEEKQRIDTNHIFIITSQPSKALYGLIVDHQYGNHSFYVYCVLQDGQKEDEDRVALLKHMDQAGIHVNEIWI